MIGLFGGTFDPVHFGHLRPALEVFKSLPFTEMRFIPCGVPGHRHRPIASPIQRLAMLRAAISSVAGFKLDTREIDKRTPCYTVETLIDLRRELGQCPLAVVIGMDALMGLPSWHRWQELIELAHLVVTHRPGWDEKEIHRNPELQRFVARHRNGDAKILATTPAGSIRFQPVTLLDISATRIRNSIKSGEDIRFLVPDQVNQLIIQQRIYV